MKKFKITPGVLVPQKYIDYKGSSAYGGLFGFPCEEPDTKAGAGYFCCKKKGHKGKHVSWNLRTRKCVNVW